MVDDTSIRVLALCALLTGVILKGLTLRKNVYVCFMCMYVLCLQGDWFCRLTWYIIMWEEFRNVYLLMTWVQLSWGDPVWLTGHIKIQLLLLLLWHVKLMPWDLCVSRVRTFFLWSITLTGSTTLSSAAMDALVSGSLSIGFSSRTLNERAPWWNYWKTTPMKDHRDENHPSQRPLQRKTSMMKTTPMKDHPNERPLCWKTTPMKDHLMKTTPLKDHPNERPPKWDHPSERPPWWDHIKKTFRSYLHQFFCFLTYLKKHIYQHNNNNNVHLSCAHQCPERSHDTY